MTDPTDLQRRAAALLSENRIQDNFNAAPADELEQMIRDLLAALSARETPQDVHCKLCGEPHGGECPYPRETPEPSALEQRQYGALISELRLIANGKHVSSLVVPVLEDAADAIAALTQRA